MSSVRHPAMTPATAAGRVTAIALIWAAAILVVAVVYLVAFLPALPGEIVIAFTGRNTDFARETPSVVLAVFLFAAAVLVAAAAVLSRSLARSRPGWAVLALSITELMVVLVAVVVACAALQLGGDGTQAATSLAAVEFAPAVVPAAIGGLLAVLLSMMSPLLAVLRGLSASGAGVLPGE